MRPQKVQVPYLSSPRTMDANPVEQSSRYGTFGRAQGATQQIVTRIHDHTAGPLPLSEVSLITAGGPLLIYCSGSARAPGSVPGRMIGIDILLDHRSVGQIKTATKHQDPTFLSGRLQVPNVPAGDHKIYLEATAGTLTHGMDLFHLVVVEFRPHPGHHNRFEGDRFEGR